MATIGRDEIELHYDGKNLPKEARENGADSGEEMGKAHAEEFDKEAKKGFGKTGDDLVKESRVSGGKAGSAGGKEFRSTFGKAIDGLAKKDLDKLAKDTAAIFHDTDGLTKFSKGLTGIEDDYARVEVAGAKVRQSLRQLLDAGALTGDEFEILAEKTRTWEGAAKDVADASSKARVETGKLSTSFFDLGKEVDASREKLRTSIDINVDDALKRIDELTDSLNNAGGGLTVTAGHVNELREASSNAAGDVDALGNATERIGKKATAAGPGVRGLFGAIDGVAKRDLGKTAADLERLGKGIEGSGKKAGIATPSMGKFVKSLGQFDPGDNLGQLIALIIALLPQLGVLAAAAGGGVLILSGAFAALALGVGGIVLGFSDVFGKIKDLPKSVQPAATAIQGLKDDFGGLRDTLQGRLFAGLADDLDRLSKTALPALNSAMDTLGGALNKVLSRWLADLNSSGFADDLDAIFTDLAPSIENLGKIASNVFGIIGQLIQDASGAANDFTKEVADATGDFLTFLKSPEGHDEVQTFLDNARVVLKKVGDVLVDVGKSVADLVTPKNIDNTIKVLDDLGSAAESLAKASGQINDFVTAFSGLVKFLAEVAGAVGDAFGQLEAGGDEALTGLQVSMSGTINAVVSFAKGIGDALGGVGEGFKKIASGDFAGGIKAIHDGLESSKQDFKDFGSNVAAASGNFSANFDTLPAKAKASLTALAGTLNVSKGDIKEFGGMFESVSAESGVSIAKISTAKGWDDLAKITGLSQTRVDQLRKQFEDSSTKSQAALAALSAKAATNLASVDSKLGASGKAAGVLTDAFIKTAGDSKTAIAGLAGAKSWADVENALGGTGAAAKTKMANNIIASAAASGVSIDKLPPKIQALISKYGDIPGKKNTTVTLDDQATAKARSIKAMVESIQNRNVTVAVHYEQTGQNLATGGAKYGARFGGVMAGGKLISGGEKLAFAAGGILNRPTQFGNILAGEAGQEAIVPLTGALSRVDKSVRGLAAYARGGIAATGYATQASAPGSGATIAAGAIVVQEAGNGRTTASAVLDRLTARLA